MIEQWMHVRAKKPIDFFLKTPIAQSLMTAKSFVSRSAKVSHRPKFVDLQYKEIKKKKGANQKWMELEKNNNPQ